VSFSHISDFKPAIDLKGLWIWGEEDFFVNLNFSPYTKLSYESRKVM